MILYRKTVNFLFIFIVALFKIKDCHSSPIRVTSTEAISTSIENTVSRNSGASALLPFLKQYGYLESRNSSNHESDTLYTQESVVEAVREMQKFGALPQTGELDEETLKLLSTPRCGLPDVIREHEKTTRRKRFVIGAKGWNKRRLTYRIENWAPELDESSVVSEIRKAFNSWADYARLRFIDKPRLSYDDVDISISFGRGHHGDRYPFDGAGGVLAHAFFPYGHGSLGGDIHFDLDEKWKPSSNESSTDSNSVSFFAVAVHEIGHSLGLGHSPSRESVMFPYYQFEVEGGGEKVRLGYDDIMAMYQLYIQRNIEDMSDKPIFPTEKPTEATTTKSSAYTDYPTSSTRYSNPTSTESTTDSYTRSTETTSIFPTVESTTFTAYSTQPSYPTRKWYYSSTTEASGNKMPDLCTDGYDAIAHIRNEIFVFKDEFMWRFRKMGMKEQGYPVKTARLFPMLENVPKIDAAFENDNGKIYFFSGNKYWTYNENGEGSENSYPITDFALPSQIYKIDGAFIWGKNKKTYFFSGNLFWRYNGTTRSMDEGYPKAIERWRGLPENGIDSVLKWTDDRTYFFKNNDFWRFDDTMVQTDQGFPLSTAAFWFGC